MRSVSVAVSVKACGCREGGTDKCRRSPRTGRHTRGARGWIVCRKGVIGVNVVLAVFIVGALIYGGAMVLQYFNYAAQILPCISRLEEEVMRLGMVSDDEETHCVEIKDRMGDINRDLGTLQRDIVAMQGQIQAERERKQRLDMIVFKERLKGKRTAMLA